MWKNAENAGKCGKMRKMRKNAEKMRKNADIFYSPRPISRFSKKIHTKNRQKMHLVLLFPPSLLLTVCDQ